MENTFPQVLLLGNGLNLAYGADNWSTLLEKIWSNGRICRNAECVKRMPFPLQAVLGTEDHVDKAILSGHPEFFGLESVEGIRELMEPLLDIGFDHILTTNYSYEVERVAEPKVKRTGKYCKTLTRSTEKMERRYLIHTYNAVPYQGNTIPVWHIHGEARKPQSVILGHYLYGKLLFRCQALLEERKNKQLDRQKAGHPMLLDTWLDAFIMGDVYVLGFRYDFSEMDLWWLLNRKKREKARHGKLYFYSPTTDADAAKFGLLEAYGAEIKILNSSDYKSFYSEAIGDIRQCVERNRRSIAHRCHQNE